MNCVSRNRKNGLGTQLNNSFQNLSEGRSPPFRLASAPHPVLLPAIHNLASPATLAPVPGAFRTLHFPLCTQYRPPPASRKCKYPVDICVAIIYINPMNVASVARLPRQPPGHGPRLGLPTVPAPAPLPPPPIPAFSPLYSGVGILPASRQGACPTLARHASENECKPPALNNRPLKWAPARKCARRCGNVPKKIISAGPAPMFVPRQPSPAQAEVD